MIDDRVLRYLVAALVAVVIVVVIVRIFAPPRQRARRVGIARQSSRDDGACEVDATAGTSYRSRRRRDGAGPESDGDSGGDGGGGGGGGD